MSAGLVALPAGVFVLPAGLVALPAGVLVLPAGLVGFPAGRAAVGCASFARAPGFSGRGGAALPDCEGVLSGRREDGAFSAGGRATWRERWTEAGRRLCAGGDSGWSVTAMSRWVAQVNPMRETSGMDGPPMAHRIRRSPGARATSRFEKSPLRNRCTRLAKSTSQTLCLIRSSA